MRKNADDTLKTKNVKQTSRLIVLAFPLLVLLFSQLLLQVPTVSAHKESTVHPYLCEEAAKLLPLGSPMRNEIFAYLGYVGACYDGGLMGDICGGVGIKYGSYVEDHVDVVYPYITYQLPGVVSNTHFWDADCGRTDPVKPLDLGAFTYGPFPNAYQKSVELFRRALDKYPNPSTRMEAYRLLGQVAHLLQDMTVPAHVHEDFHPGALIPGGDDCFEEWYSDPAVYEQWGAGSVVGAKLITFPPEVAAQTRQGRWSEGLYYLMYTTNQMADYFASDDYSGDRVDPEGWIDYPSDWRGGPRRKSDLDDNDDLVDDDGDSWGEAFSNNNDDDGDLSFIASKTIPYGLRATATLYKMFYEATHPPTATINIYYADADGNDHADYRNVRLDLTYDVGASEYFQDLEAWYGNAEPVPATQFWESVGAVPGHHAKQWVLSEGDGPKTVWYQVRNLMGRTATVTASVVLEEVGLPLTFDYSFKATGTLGLTARVSFWMSHIYVKKTSGDGDVEFYMPWRVDNGAGQTLWPHTVLPADDLYFITGPGVDYDYGDGMIPLYDLYGYMMDERGGQHWSGSPLWHKDASKLAEFGVNPGTWVRLRTHGWDYDPWPNPDDDLGNVWTPAYYIPTVEGVYDLTGGYQWFSLTSSGWSNEYYSIRVRIVATVASMPWEGWEYNQAGDVALYTGAIFYGEEPEYISSSHLGPPATAWQAIIDPVHSMFQDLPHTGIGHYMADGGVPPVGPELWAWLEDSQPDMVIVAFNLVLGPEVFLLISDPDDYKIGTRVAMAVDPETSPNSTILTTERFDQIVNASVSYLDLDGYGGQDTVVVFNNRKPGIYHVEVTGINLTTYSIGVNTYGQRKLGPPYDPPPPTQFEFLVEDATAACVYEFESTDTGANLPPTADLGDLKRGVEGTALTLDAGGSRDPDGDSLGYQWDFDNDGTWDTIWSSSPTAAFTWPDDWTGMVKVMVKDGTFNDTAIAPVIISNAAPTVTAGPDQLAAPGEVVYFSGSVTDPAAELDPYTVLWHFGDGATATGTLTPTHAYAGAGKYRVNVTVTDDDGGIDVGGLTVTTDVDATIVPLVACIPPGASDTYSVLIHHLGTTQDTYTLELAGLNPAWYSLSTTTVTLDPDQSSAVTLTVSPPRATPIATYGFTVLVTSQSDPDAFDPADADVIVFEDYDPSSGPNGPREEDLVVLYYTTQEAAYTALSGGEIDFIGGAGYSAALFPAGTLDAGSFLTSSQADVAFTNPNIVTARVRAFNMYQFDLNNNGTIADYPNWRSPMNYTELRQAIAFLANKDYYVGTLLGGKAERIDQPLPARLADWGNASLAYPNYPYEYSTAAAKALLDTTFPPGTTPNPDYDPLEPLSSSTLRTYPAGHEKAGLTLDPLKFCIRTDHNARLQAGRSVASWLKKLGVPINAVEGSGSILVPIVMTDMNYHFYTGAWTTWKYPTHVYPLYHSSFAAVITDPSVEQWNQFWSLGDVNRDGAVDQTDIDLILPWFGYTVPPAPPECDLNEDDFIDIDDLMIASFNYGLDIWTYFGLMHAQAHPNYVTGYGTHPRLDQYLADVYYAQTFADSVAACRLAMGEFTRKCVSVPLWSDYSYCAWNTHLLATVNMDGYGIMNPYTFMNAYKTDGSPIRCGLINRPLGMNTVHSGWAYDIAGLNLMNLYSSVDTPPYSLAIDQPGFVADWETSTWNDGNETKTMVGIRIRRDGCFAAPVSGDRGEQVNASHVFWNAWIDFQEGDGWFWPSFKDLHHIDFRGSYSCDIYFDTLSYWHTYAATGPLRPMNTWMAQGDTFIANITETVAIGTWPTPETPLLIDLTHDPIWISSVIFTNETTSYPIPCINDPYYPCYIIRGDFYVNPVYAGIGNYTVTYHYVANGAALRGFTPGALPWQTIFEGAGPYYCTAFNSLTGATFKRSPYYYMETPLLGDVDFIRNPNGAYYVDIFDLALAGGAFGSHGTGIPSSNWFPGADLAPEAGTVAILDLVTVTGTNWDKEYDPLY